MTVAHVRVEWAGLYTAGEHADEGLEGVDESGCDDPVSRCKREERERVGME